MHNPATSRVRQGQPERLSHAALDLGARRPKAEKIERLLGIETVDRKFRLLEVGTGAGGIAHYFAAHASGRYDVDAVDVIDNRQIKDGFRYQNVSGVELPFEDASFDVVISNHVIEHVGNRDAQIDHLKELRRVMTAHGVGYLAAPNRWMVTEPHYRLAFLSWLPRPLRTPYLRWRKRGSTYDCEPLTADSLEKMLRQVGFSFHQQHGNALRITFDLERPNSLFFRLFIRPAPDVFFVALRKLFPTLIYILRPSSSIALRTGPGPIFQTTVEQ